MKSNHSIFISLPPPPLPAGTMPPCLSLHNKDLFLANYGGGLAELHRQKPLCSLLLNPGTDNRLLFLFHFIVEGQHLFLLFCFVFFLKLPGVCEGPHLFFSCVKLVVQHLRGRSTRPRVMLFGFLSKENIYIYIQ